jgi:hypothetical protein
MTRWILLTALLVGIARLGRFALEKWRLRVTGTPLTGRLTEFHANGRMKSERHVQDGMMHGPWLLWDEHGSKVGEGAYDRGIVHGLEVDFGADGVKLRETPWVQGRRHGIAREYGMDGEVLPEQRIAPEAGEQVAWGDVDIAGNRKT